MEISFAWVAAAIDLPTKRISIDLPQEPATENEIEQITEVDAAH
jgi:hypothetical protein